MRWDESPKFLLIASIASAGLSASLGLTAIWDHPGYNVAAAALALLTAILGYRAVRALDSPATGADPA
jgi:membrane protein implicated in regulation of membrane protease activity